MDCTYKGMGGYRVGGESWVHVQPEAGHIYFPIALFGVVMSPRSVNHRPRQA